MKSLVVMSHFKHTQNTCEVYMTSHTAESRDRMGSDVVNVMFREVAFFHTEATIRKTGYPPRTKIETRTIRACFVPSFPPQLIVSLGCVEKTGTKLQEGQNVEI